MEQKQHKGGVVIGVPIKRYEELLKKERLYDEAQKKLADGGKKRWSDKTEAERKAAMEKVREHKR